MWLLDGPSNLISLCGAGYDNWLLNGLDCAMGVPIHGLYREPPRALMLPKSDCEVCQGIVRCC